MEHDLDKMEEMIGATIPAQKLAETRLERRTYRPIGELCCDAAQHGLINEKNQIETTRGALLEKQAQMRHALNDLYKQLKHIKDDLRDKYSSLQLETRCLDLRGCHMHEEGLKEGDNEAEAIPSNFHEPGDAETTTSSGIGDRISALTNFSAIRL
ncbi:unnamed protein product [Protopolystoma xenopodis]|uniref:Tektin n=1 Tax=Protopolystoma xenopodis TaxID=117903 RepID=A0A448WRV2_9PLAT|nr:unnamed protein product [Protopolystoma xenopodis]